MSIIIEITFPNKDTLKNAESLNKLSITFQRTNPNTNTTLNLSAYKPIKISSTGNDKFRFKITLPKNIYITVCDFTLSSLTDTVSINRIYIEFSDAKITDITFSKPLLINPSSPYKHPPVDCEVSKWSPFSSCTRICGGGIQTQTRTIIQKESNGGIACPTDLLKTQPCNTQTCPVYYPNPTFLPTLEPNRTVRIDKVEQNPNIVRDPNNIFEPTSQPVIDLKNFINTNMNAQNNIANNSQANAPNPISKIIDNQKFKLPGDESPFSWYTDCFPFINGILPNICPSGYYNSGLTCLSNPHIKEKGCCCNKLKPCCPYPWKSCFWRQCPSCCSNCEKGYTDMGCTCQRDVTNTSLQCPSNKAQGLFGLCYDEKCKDYGCFDMFKIGFDGKVKYNLGEVSFNGTNINFDIDKINVNVNMTYTGGFVNIYLPKNIVVLKCNNSSNNLDFNSPTISIPIPSFSVNFGFNIPLKLSDKLFDFKPIGDTGRIAEIMNEGINSAIVKALGIINEAIKFFNTLGAGLWETVKEITISEINLKDIFKDCLDFINDTIKFISNKLGEVFNGLSLRKIIDKVTPPIQNIINQIDKIKDSADEWINKTANYVNLYYILASRILEASIDSGNILENILLSMFGLDVLSDDNLDQDIRNLGKKIFGITENYSESYYDNYSHNYSHNYSNSYYDNYNNNYYSNNSQIQPYYSQYQHYSYPNYNGIEKYQTVTYEALTQNQKNIINDICNRQRGLNFEGTSDVNAKYEKCKTALGPYINTNNDIKDWNFNYSSFSVNFSFSLPFYILAFLGITVNPAIVPVLLFLGKTLSISVSMGYSMDVQDLGRGTGNRQFIYSIGISFTLPPSVDPKTLGLNLGMSIVWSPMGSNSDSPSANIFKGSKNQNFSISADFTVPATIIRTGMQSIINGVRMFATRSTLGGVITAAAAGGTIAGVNEIGDQSMVFPSMVLGAASLYNAKDVTISLSWTISDYYDVNNQAIKLNNQHKIFQGFSDIPGQGNLITRQATPLNSIPSVSIGTTFTAYSEVASTSGGVGFGVTVSYNDACNKTSGSKCER